MSSTLVEEFKRFWTAEEVPRWFGLSLVLLYLGGLGAVGHFAVVQVREEAAAEYRSSNEYALQVFADRLSAIAGARSGASVGQSHGAGFQRALRDFAAHVPTRSLRIVDSKRRVLASTSATEIGSICPQTVSTTALAEGMEAADIAAEDGGQPDLFYRMLLATGDAHATGPSVTSRADGGQVDADGAGSEDGGELYLEARLPSEPARITGLADHAGTLVTVLVVCGALFALFRCLRTQLRSVTLIADRLRSPLDTMKADLDSLRMSDTKDMVSTAWNQLIELAVDLQGEVGRAQANQELSAALAGSSGSALARAMNAVPDGILYLSHEGRVEYANAMACRFMAWEETDARGTVITEAEAGGIGERILSVVLKALQPRGGFDSLTEVLETEGGDSAHRVWVIPLQGAKQEGEAVVIIRDVSQQIRADRSREDFVAQVTHELRTPLTNIRAYAETLSSGMFDDPKMITECYNVITKETRRLSRLIEDILSVSQMEVGSIELEKDTVDLKALLTDGAGDVRGLADEKDIDLQVVLPAKLEPIVADRDKLAVVINNILGNAIKYTQKGGSVVVGCQAGDGEMTITFKDNGIGVDPADHARIFEKFQRAGDPEVQQETGTGIGLYTAREIIRRHGGEIDLMSEKGQGSTFIVRLPYSESRAGALSVSQEA